MDVGIGVAVGAGAGAAHAAKSRQIGAVRARATGGSRRGNRMQGIVVDAARRINGGGVDAPL